MDTNIPINLKDDAHWNAQIQTVDALSATTEDLLAKANRIGGKSNIVRELSLSRDLLGAVRLAWDMTESVPGEVAAMTIEPVEDDERIELRRRIHQAISIAQEVAESAKTVLNNV